MHACRHLSGTCLPTHARVWVPLNRHEDSKGQKSPQAHNCSIRPDAATYLLGSTPRPICYYYLLSRLGSTPRPGTQTHALMLLHIVTTPNTSTIASTSRQDDYFRLPAGSHRGSDEAWR